MGLESPLLSYHDCVKRASGATALDSDLREKGEFRFPSNILSPNRDPMMSQCEVNTPALVVVRETGGWVEGSGRIAW